jgi:glc operon protein GlcG
LCLKNKRGKENMYQSYRLSYIDALEIVTAIRAELEKQDTGAAAAEGAAAAAGAAVAVVDEYGELIAFLRTDGCKLPSINIAINKAFTAAREGVETRAIGDASRHENFPMTNFGDLRYTAWGGGVPIKHQGKVIGAVGVSGLPEEEDMKLARMGASLIE